MVFFFALPASNNSRGSKVPTSATVPWAYTVDWRLLERVMEVAETLKRFLKSAHRTKLKSYVVELLILFFPCATHYLFVSSLESRMLLEVVSRKGCYVMSS